MCNFYVGQKVLCVDADTGPLAYWLDGEQIYLHRVYTIRWMGETPAYQVHQDALAGLPSTQATVRLREVLRHRVDGIELGYRATRFRPLTDISSLEALLTQAPKTKTRESEDA